MVFRDRELIRIAMSELSDSKAVVLAYDWREIYERETP